MAEDLEKSEEKSKKKLESRKFVVWLVWCTISVAVIGYCFLIAIVTKQFTENFVSLVEKVLGWFFGVSMMYIGANATQKVGFAFADAMKTEESEK